jgi:signal transduction histidine kinase
MPNVETALPSSDAERREAPPASSLPPQFLARLAHDIRSPLGLLSGALEEIRADLGAQLDEGHHRMLALAERGLTRLDRMAKTLSTISQIEAGTLGLERASHDVARVVREVVDSVEREDPRRGLELTLELPAEAKAQIDPERVRESLWELVAQSRRQAKSAVRIALTEKAGGLELRIEDDGRGVEPSERKHAFDRLHEPHDRRGSGFALSVSRDLIRAHGGDVELCDASPSIHRSGSAGTCYLVTLPR